MHRIILLSILALALTWLGAPSRALAAFTAGDLYLLTTDDPVLATAIIRIDPHSGVASTFFDVPETPIPAGQPFAYDPFRDLLLYTDNDAGGGIPALDSSATPSRVAPGLARPTRFAARSDGILYLWYGSPRTLRYLDASDTVHDLLNQAGSAAITFAAPAGVNVMLYHASTNSLILVAEFGFAGCTATNDTCAIKVPLTPAGTQAAGPSVSAQVDIPSSTERPHGIGYGPGDSIYIAVDTNDNGQEPRMQLLNPVTMAFSPFASSGSFIGAAVISAGTYSSVAGVGLIFDSFANVIRAYTLGSSGAGTTFTDASGFSGTGHSEIARLVEIQAGPAPMPVLPGWRGWLLAALAVLAATGVLASRHREESGRS